MSLGSEGALGTAKDARAARDATALQAPLIIQSNNPYMILPPARLKRCKSCVLHTCTAVCHSLYATNDKFPRCFCGYNCAWLRNKLISFVALQEMASRDSTYMLVDFYVVTEFVKMNQEPNTELCFSFVHRLVSLSLGG